VKASAGQSTADTARDIYLSFDQTQYGVQTVE
jgi:hypothetical protein